MIVNSRRSDPRTETFCRQNFNISSEIFLLYELWVYAIAES